MLSTRTATRATISRSRRFRKQPPPLKQRRRPQPIRRQGLRAAPLPLGYLFSRESLAWMTTFIHLSGGFAYSNKPSYILISSRIAPQRPVTRARDRILRRLSRLTGPRQYFQRQQPTWKPARGSKKSQHDGAKYYLMLIDHNQQEKVRTPLEVLADAVCNLRNSYQQTKLQTVELITTVYNPRCGINWSAEDIELTWEMVEGFTPSLWLRDSRYLASQRREAIQRELKDLLSTLTPAPCERIHVEVMLNMLNEWDPTLKVTPRELGDAMRALTGHASRPSNGVSYYFGYRLPAQEDAGEAGRIWKSANLKCLHKEVNPDPFCPTDTEHVERRSLNAHQ